MRTGIALLGLAACALGAWGLSRFLDVLDLAKDSIWPVVVSLVFLILCFVWLRAVLFFGSMLLGLDDG